MSQANTSTTSIQINSSVAPVTLFTKQGDTPPDIKKLILANTSATACLVTISDGVKNYYYVVPASNTLIDNGFLTSDKASTSWTATCNTSVNSIYVTAKVN